MCDYDFDGDMAYYQDQLTAAGISQEEVNMDNFAGLTAKQLQGVVDFEILRRKKNGTII